MPRTLLLLLPLVLAACRPGPVPPGGTPATPGALLALIDRAPMPMPEAIPAGLGPSGRLTGPTRYDLRPGASISGNSALTGTPVGEITGPKTVSVALGAGPFPPRLPIQQLIRDVTPISLPGLCAVATVTYSADSSYTSAEFFAKRADLGGASLAPQTSPIPDFVPVLPAVLADGNSGYERTGLLVHVDRDTLIRGELRCVQENVMYLEDARRYYFKINVELKAGWNVLRESERSVRSSRGEDVFLFVTGATDHYAFGERS